MCVMSTSRQTTKKVEHDRDIRCEMKFRRLQQETALPIPKLRAVKCCLQPVAQHISTLLFPRLKSLFFLGPRLPTCAIVTRRDHHLAAGTIQSLGRPQSPRKPMEDHREVSMRAKESGRKEGIPFFSFFRTRELSDCWNVRAEKEINGEILDARTDS